MNNLPLSISSTFRNTVSSERKDTLKVGDKEIETSTHMGVFLYNKRGHAIGARSGDQSNTFFNISRLSSGLYKAVDVVSGFTASLIIQ
jgi:hypothetical protein